MNYGERVKNQIITILEKNNLTTNQLQNKILGRGIYSKLLPEIPINHLRDFLKELQNENKIEWTARWYGRNAGYCRVWRIKEETGDEDEKTT
jgi:ribosomal protein L17